jgi:hypothetical protein
VVAVDSLIMYCEKELYAMSIMSDFFTVVQIKGFHLIKNCTKYFVRCFFHIKLFFIEKFKNFYLFMLTQSKPASFNYFSYAYFITIEQQK